MDRKSIGDGMRSTVVVVVLCLLASFLSARPAVSQTANDELLDEVVAVVNNKVITRSEVVEEAILLLVYRKGPAGLSRRLTGEYLGQVLELLINQRILLDEARRIELPSVTEEDNQKMLADFQKLFGARSSYSRFLLDYGISEESISQALVRYYRIDLMRKQKLEFLAQVSDEKVSQYYRVHRTDFGGAPLSAVGDAIRHRLSAQAQQRALARWISNLTKRSQIQVLVDMTGVGNQDAE
jgi:hypothetical protein